MREFVSCEVWKMETHTTHKYLTFTSKPVEQHVCNQGLYCLSMISILKHNICDMH